MTEDKGVIKAIQPIVTPTYRLHAELGRESSNLAETFTAAVNAIYDWFQSKLKEPLPVGQNRLSSFRAHLSDPDLEVISIADLGIWSARLTHLDTGLINGRPVYGRRWVTDIGLLKENDTVFFGVQISALSQPGLDAPIDYIRPGIIKSLVGGVGVAQLRPLSESCWRVSGAEDVSMLKDLLMANERQLPIILITQPDRNKWELSRNVPEYLVDPDVAARKLIGYAHVVAMPFREAYGWTNTLGKVWSAFDGAVRIYHKNFNMAKDETSRHPLFLKEKIHFHRYKEKFGDDAFLEYLYDELRKTNSASFQQYHKVMYLNDARIAKAKYDRELYLTKDECVGCRELYEEEIAAYQIKLEEAQADANQWSDSSIDAENASKFYQKENEALRRQLDSLRLHLEAKSGESADSSLVLPGSYEDIPGWVSDYLSGRLVLHPRAYRGLKEASYENIEEVCNCLLLLANEYRSMKLSLIGKDRYEQKIKELSVHVGGSIAKERAGEQGDTYYIEYPIGSQRKTFLESHLRKGSNKDARYTLAIYYFWDDETRQVVVGWLPSHLRNRMT